MKTLHFITVRGKQHEWAFEVLVDREHVQEWRDDGLEIYEIENSIPEWVPSELIRAWCFVQDVFHLKNPFRGTTRPTKEQQ